MDIGYQLSTVYKDVAKAMEMALVEEQNEAEKADEVQQEVMEMVHTYSSIKMENHSIIVFILLILEDIFPMLTYIALQCMRDIMCTVKDKVEVEVSIMQFVVVVVVEDVGTIIITTGFSRLVVKIKMTMMSAHLNTKRATVLKENRSQTTINPKERVTEPYQDLIEVLTVPQAVASLGK